MFQRALKVGLLAVVFVVLTQSANAFGRWGCGYGGGGGCGYGGCGYGYGGYYGGYYGGGGYPGMMYGGYMAQRSPTTAAASVARQNTASPASGSDSAVLVVKVPADAKVVINGLPTKSVGEVRRYKSVGLEPSASYRYQVHAEFVINGQPVSQEKIIDLPAGQETTIAFDAAAKSETNDVAATSPREVK